MGKVLSCNSVSFAELNISVSCRLFSVGESSKHFYN
eukprot:06710.XXX_25797_25904_1 [CDS] Oithona nana genome sequencing.